ncbi:MAG: hypothetical protein C5B56_13045 [Proteobacteria bacterium]|nr:MAG: hypothetical protein C5B56_13045 [Pseudomonadota bacterium]
MKIMRNGTENQHKSNETLKLDTFSSRETTADEVDQVAGGWCSPGAFFMNQILAARAADLLYYRCAGPCPGE